MYNRHTTMSEYHSTIPPHKPAIKRGAEQGLIMGLYLSLTFVAAASTMWHQWVSIPALLLMAGVPAIIYFMLRRTYVADYGCTTFSEMWMQGIMIFVGGSIIMATVSYLYMKVLVPDYILQLFERSIEAMTAMGQTEQAHLVRRIIDQGKILTPGEVAIEFVWVGIFSGSLLSMVMAWIVRLTCKSTK